jgi:AcrR family transcriptional regulator
MSSKKRPYQLRARAERQEETRRRIAAATAELHEEVGPARTTIAEVARRAGVQRPTVYNNFPTERDLFAACSAHFLEHHPRPGFASALAREDPRERLEAVLAELYGWYRRTAGTSGNVARDRHLLPELDALLAETADAQMDGLATELARGFGARGRRAVRLRASIRLALDYGAWERLSAEGLSDAEAAAVFAAATSG